MADFDPDAYLSGQQPAAGGFDPDAYLGVVPQQRTPASVAAEMGENVGPSEGFNRALGLTGRAGLQGVGDILDTLAAPFRVGVNALGADIQGRTGAAVADMIGLPTPANPTERMSGAVAEAMAGGAVPIAAGNALAASSLNAVRQNLGKILAANPQLQTVLSGFAGAGGQAAQEGGAGAGGQLAASMAAPMAAVLAAKPTAIGVRKVTDALGPMFTGRQAELAAGRIGADVAGDRAPQVAQAMTVADPMLTAGQASAGVGSAEMAGLERIVGSHAPSVYGPHGVVPVGQQTALDDMWSRLNTQTGPAREAALTTANANGGLSVAGLSMDVAALKSNPSYSNATAQKILGWVDRELVRVADPQTGEVNARALYNVRKDLGLAMQKWAKKEDWDKSTGRGVLADIQRKIDWEIDNNLGNTQWSEGYIEPFARGAKPITGLKEQIKQANEMGAAGVGKASRIASLDEAPLKAPGMLDRTITVLNSLLRAGQGYGGEQTTKRLADLMQPQNKAAFGKLIAEELRRREGRVGFGEAMQRAGRAGLYNEGLGD